MTEYFSYCIQGWSRDQGFDNDAFSVACLNSNLSAIFTVGGNDRGSQRHQNFRRDPKH